MRWSVAVLSGWAIALGAAVPALADPVGAYTEYGAGITPNSYPNAIVTGPDGNLWFTEFVGDRIGRITPDGVVTEFAVPGANPAPDGIAAGPDGNVWFTAIDGHIGRITPAGVVTLFPLPTSTAFPQAIALGPDGNLWFTESDIDKIGRITPLGVITEFAAGITAGSRPGAITAGPDGNLWFVETAAAHAAVARITTAGVVTEFLTPTPDSLPTAIVAGPDGNLWVPEKRVAKMARVTPAGVITEMPTNIPGQGPNAITVGPDGNLWMALQSGRVARFTTAGVATTFPTGTAQGLFGITLGPDQQLWFTEYFAQRIGRMNAIAPPTPTPCTAAVTGVTPASAPAGAEVTISGSGFGCATGVRFGDAPTAGFAIGGFDRITARVPEHAPGEVDVRVLTGAGASPVVAAGRFTFTAALDVLATPELAAPLAAARRLTCMRVPTLTGATLGGARRILARDGCAVRLTVTGKRPRRGHRRVTAQTPGPGTPLYAGDRDPAVRFG